MKTLVATAIIFTLSASGAVYATSTYNTQRNINFWNENGQLIERSTNPNDYSGFIEYEPARTGSQPAVGSASDVGNIPMNTSNFWKDNGRLIERSTNPNDYSGY